MTSRRWTLMQVISLSFVGILFAVGVVSALGGGPDMLLSEPALQAAP